jgi:hypothetical protein
MEHDQIVGNQPDSLDRRAIVIAANLRKDSELSQDIDKFNRMEKDHKFKASLAFLSGMFTGGKGGRNAYYDSKDKQFNRLNDLDDKILNKTAAMLIAHASQLPSEIDRVDLLNRVKVAVGIWYDNAIKPGIFSSGSSLRNGFREVLDKHLGEKAGIGQTAGGPSQRLNTGATQSAETLDSLRSRSSSRESITTQYAVGSRAR